MRLFRTLPREWEASVSEFENIAPRGDRPSVDAVELEAVHLSFAAKPLAVLTAGGRGTDARTAEAWREGHDRIAALSIRGSNTIVPGARHYIQFDQPQVAIRGVVDTVRLR